MGPHQTDAIARSELCAFIGRVEDVRELSVKAWRDWFIGLSAIEEEENGGWIITYLARLADETEEAEEAED